MDSKDVSHNDYEIRTVAMILIKKNGNIFGDDSATRVEILDEGGGEFLQISQADSYIRINPEEWLSLRELIEKMLKEVRG